ncbi:hypothetical protein CC80DRAFT_88015 [Byssothecium circinans]|uniref:Uncharacterized protein n=1 Tax=Byssothecium circinans TaxID=147558 RepID=A0A6A5TUD9_9PLEO|nr:hypothetical protein CC80DRAFT_88015 [Byssothecium circinans]
MSAAATSDPVKESGAASKSKKKKNKKKSGGANKVEEAASVNGNVEKHEEHTDEPEDDEEEQHPHPAAQSADRDDVDDDQPLSPTAAQANGNKSHSISSAVALGLSRSRSQQGLSPSPPPPSDTSARLDAIAKERDALRQEVIELRKSLEGIQEKHESEISSLQGELEESNENRDHFETQYQNLLGRVNTIKTSLGDRLKADAVGPNAQERNLGY